MDATMKCKKAGGNNAHKIFMSRVEEGNIRKLFMTTMKMKNKFCKTMKCKKGGGKNAHNIFMSQVEEGNIRNTISYVELFMTNLKMKSNFCDGYQ